MYTLYDPSDACTRYQTLVEVVDGVERVLGENGMLGVGVEVVLDKANDGLDGNVGQGDGAEEPQVSAIVITRGPL